MRMIKAIKSWKPRTTVTHVGVETTQVPLRSTSVVPTGVACTP
jgi:hypothetical protein